MANETIFKRYEGNPIITPEDVGGNCNSIFNSSVIPFGEGYVGIFRVDTMEMEVEMRVGRSKDGIIWEIEPEMMDVKCDEPDMGGDGRGYDPRITKLEDTYYITYCNSYHGATIGIIETKDFKSFKHICNAFPPYNRNGVLFPRRIKGQFAMLHRPHGGGHATSGSIFYATSPDLISWGRHKRVFGPAGQTDPGTGRFLRGGGWQGLKIGAGPPPIETNEGWLLIYHAVRPTCSGFIYCVGGAILDIDEPWKAIYRTKRYLMAPTKLYERVGDVPNVVFPTSLILYKDTGQLAMYYGAADTVMAVAYAQLDELIDFIKKNSF